MFAALTLMLTLTLAACASPLDTGTGFLFDNLTVAGAAVLDVTYTTFHTGPYNSFSAVITFDGATVGPGQSLDVTVSYTLTPFGAPVPSIYGYVDDSQGFYTYSGTNLAGTTTYTQCMSGVCLQDPDTGILPPQGWGGFYVPVPVVPARTYTIEATVLVGAGSSFTLNSIAVGTTATTTPEPAPTWLVLVSLLTCAHRVRLGRRWGWGGATRRVARRAAP